MATKMVPIMKRSKKVAAFTEANMLMRRPVKNLAVATYELIEEVMRLDESINIKTAAKILHEYAAAHGDNVALSVARLQTYHSTVEWLVGETGSYEWVDGLSFEQHNKARRVTGNNGYNMLQDGMILDVRANGTNSEKLWTTIKRAVAQLRTENEVASINAKGVRSNKQRTSKVVHRELTLAMPHLEDAIDAVSRAA